MLPRLSARIPDTSAIFVFHAHVANRLSAEAKRLLLDTVQELARDRDVFHLYNTISDLHLHLDGYTGSLAFSEVLAETDGHGHWFRWKLVASL